MADEKRRVTINMIAQTIAFVVNIVVNYAITPYVTAHVGTVVYGYVNLAFTVTGYITLLTTVLNAMVGRYVTISIAKDDYESANKYFSSAVYANGIMAAITTIPAVFTIIFLQRIIKVPVEHLADIKMLWLFIFAAFILTMVTQFYGIATYASNRLELAAKRNVEKIFLNALILFVCFYFFDAKVWYIGFAYFICSFYIIITNIYYTRKLQPKLRFHRRLVSTAAMLELMSVGVWNAVQQLSSTLINGCDTLIANKCIDAEAMALMSFAKTAPNYIMSFIGTINGAFGPELTIAYGKGDKDKFIKMVNSDIKICGVLCSIPILGFIAFGESFYGLWLYSLNATQVRTVQILSVMIMAQTVFDVYIYPLYTVNQITCKLKIPVYVSLGIGVANIVGSILLCEYTNMGVYAIQIVSSVLLVARVFFFAPIYAAHILETKWWTFYVPLLRGALASVIVLVVFFIYACLVPIHSWMMLMISGLICGAVGYVINFFVVLNKEERDKALGIVRRKLKR